MAVLITAPFLILVCGLVGYILVMKPAPYLNFLAVVSPQLDTLASSFRAKLLVLYATTSPTLSILLKILRKTKVSRELFQVYDVIAQVVREYVGNDACESSSSCEKMQEIMINRSHALGMDYAFLTTLNATSENTQLVAEDVKSGKFVTAESEDAQAHVIVEKEKDDASSSPEEAVDLKKQIDPATSDIPCLTETSATLEFNASLSSDSEAYKTKWDNAGTTCEAVAELSAYTDPSPSSILVTPSDSHNSVLTGMQLCLTSSPKSKQMDAAEFLRSNTHDQADFREGLYTEGGAKSSPMVKESGFVLKASPTENPVEPPSYRKSTQVACEFPDNEINAVAPSISESAGFDLSTHECSTMMKDSSYAESTHQRTEYDEIYIEADFTQYSRHGIRDTPDGKPATLGEPPTFKSIIVSTLSSGIPMQESPSSPLTLSSIEEEIPVTLDKPQESASGELSLYLGSSTFTFTPQISALPLYDINKYYSGGEILKEPELLSSENTLRTGGLAMLSSEALPNADHNHSVSAKTPLVNDQINTILASEFHEYILAIGISSENLNKTVIEVDERAIDAKFEVAPVHFEDHTKSKNEENTSSSDAVKIPIAFLTEQSSNGIKSRSSQSPKHTPCATATPSPSSSRGGLWDSIYAPSSEALSTSYPLESMPMSNVKQVGLLASIHAPPSSSTHDNSGPVTPRTRNRKAGEKANHTTTTTPTTRRPAQANILRKKRPTVIDSKTPIASEIASSEMQTASPSGSNKPSNEQRVRTRYFKRSPRPRSSTQSPD